MAELFKRFKEVIIEGLNSSLCYPDLEINFEGDFDDKPDPNIYKLEIYNLSQDTISKIKKNAKIIVNAGYDVDVGNVVAGRIKEVVTEKNGVDIITKIDVYDLTDEWMNNTVNLTFNGPTTAEDILREITKDLGIELGVIELVENRVYQNGKTVFGKLPAVLKKIVTVECKSNLIIRDGRIDIVRNNKGFETAFILNSDSGLIGSPTKIDSEDTIAEYKVNMLFNYHMKPRSLIEIQSKVVSGLFVVIKGSHTKDFETEVEVRAVG